MLSKKEKKAIKDCDIIFINLEDMMSEEGANKYKSSYRIIKKLIEEQQNEIEDLKIKNKKIQEINYRVNKNLLELAETSISKDKIRKTIEDLEKHRIMSSDDFTIKVLRALLKE